MNRRVARALVDELDRKDRERWWALGCSVFALLALMLMFTGCGEDSFIDCPCDDPEAIDKVSDDSSDDSRSRSDDGSSSGCEKRV